MTEIEIPLEQRFNSETAKISWKELEVFFAKGNLLQIANGEDIISVAQLIVSNAQDDIETLILNKRIEFVTPQWIKQNCQATTELWTLVVAPYVLCQLT